MMGFLLRSRCRWSSSSCCSWPNSKAMVASFSSLSRTCCHLLLTQDGSVSSDEDSEAVTATEEMSYSLADKNLWFGMKGLKSNNRLQEDLEHSRCISSSCGWLTYLNPRNGAMHILNPFFDNPPIVPLPPIESLPSILFTTHRRLPPSSPSPFHTDFLFRRRFVPTTPKDTQDDDDDDENASPLENSINSIVLSSSPCRLNTEGRSGWKKDCLVAMSQDETLAFCGVGDKAWTVLEDGNYYSELVFSGQTLFAIHYDIFYTGIVAWDLRDTCRPKRLFTQNFDSHLPLGAVGLKLMYECDPSVYLAGLSTSSLGDGGVRQHSLLMAIRYIDREKCRTKGFDLLKVEYRGGENKCSWVDDLGDEALFLDHNQAALVSARDFPDLKPNSIYFYRHTHHGVGVFTLGDASLTSSCIASLPTKIGLEACWVIPS